MSGEEYKPVLAEDAKATHAGSVYHMQQGRRRSPYPPRSPARHGVRSVSRKQSKSSSVGHAVLISHVRTFALVAVFMAGLLGLAVYITGRTWQRHIVRVREARSAASPAPAARPADAAHAGGVVVGDAMGGGLRGRTELDTESMRRALVMQSRAETLREAGELDRALETFQDALRIWLHLTQVWPQKGRIHLELGQYARAEVALERAVESDPANVELLNDLGVAVLYQNRIQSAMALFDTVLELDGEFAPAFFNRALGLMVLDQYEAAENEIDAFLALRPGDPAALKEKAYLQATRLAYADALVSLQSALSAAPEWAALHIDAAAVAALKGDIEGAIGFLDSAEILTGPDLVFRIYQQPAFRAIRLSEAGMAFQQVLGERARVRLTDEQSSSESVGGSLPMPSVNSQTAALLGAGRSADVAQDEHIDEE